MMTPRQILQRIREDARGAALYARSLGKVFALSRKKKRDSKALLVAYREIGDRASETEEAKSRRSFGSVKENEERLVGCEAALTAALKRESGAQLALEDQTRIREGELEVLAGEATGFSRAHDERRRERRDLRKQIDRVESRLEKPGDDDSPAELKVRLAQLREELPEREDGVSLARRQEEAAVEDLTRAKRAWREEERRLETDLRDASREARHAEVRREEARAAVEGSHEALGKSVVLAGLDEPGIREPMDRARALLAAIKASDEGMRERRVAAAAVRTEATRFAAVWGGVLLLLVIIPGVIFSGNAERGGETRILPEPSTLSANPSIPSDSDPVSAGVPLPCFRDALLAHPALTSVKPTGKIEIVSRSPAAGGAERIEVKVYADRSGEPVRVNLRVVVDSEGKLLGVEHRGTETGDDDELMRLLLEMDE